MNRRYFQSAAFAIGITWLLALSPTAARPTESAQTAPPARAPVSPGWIKVTIEPGDTLTGILAGRADLTPAQVEHIADRLERILDPNTLRPGQTIRYRTTSTASDTEDPQLVEFRLRRDIDTWVVLKRTATDESLVATTERVPHDRTLERIGFAIDDSLYRSARLAGAPQSILPAVRRVLSGQVDFRRTLHPGDRVDIVFERFRHDSTGGTHPGALIAASLRQEDRQVAIYRFETSDGAVAYYDAAGVSVETTLSAIPVAGGRLSSRFGRRDHPLLDTTRMHRGLDFAAARGTPVVAADAGRVVRAGRYGSFGRYVRIRHDTTFESAYAHLARIADGLKAGDAVRRGEVIGYVGATGLATGPNLHYEVLRDGEQVNPRTLDLPPNRTLETDDLRALQRKIDRLGLSGDAGAKTASVERRRPSAAESITYAGNDR